MAKEYIYVEENCKYHLEQILEIMRKEETITAKIFSKILNISRQNAYLVLSRLERRGYLSSKRIKVFTGYLPSKRIKVFTNRESKVRVFTLSDKLCPPDD